MFVQGALHIAYISQKDRSFTEKYTKITAVWVFLLAFMIYLLGVFSYYKDDSTQTYILHYMTGIVMLLCLPVTLITLSVLVITAGNV
jgi:hypothetical protein